MKLWTRFKIYSAECLEGNTLLFWQPFFAASVDRMHTVSPFSRHRCVAILHHLALFSTQVSIFLHLKRMRRWKVSHVRTVYVWGVYFRACKLCHLEQKQTEKWHFGGRRKTGFLFVTSPLGIHRCQKQFTATFLLQPFFSCDNSLVWNWRRRCKK
jgi:hypothetical protein